MLNIMSVTCVTFMSLFVGKCENCEAEFPSNSPANLCVNPYVVIPAAECLLWVLGCRHVSQVEFSERKFFVLFWEGKEHTRFALQKKQTPAKSSYEAFSQSIFEEKSRRQSRKR